MYFGFVKTKRKHGENKTVYRNNRVHHVIVHPNLPIMAETKPVDIDIATNNGVIFSA